MLGKAKDAKPKRAKKSGFKHHFKKHFVPHRGNANRPHLLRIESAIVILCIVILIELIALVQPFLISLNKNFYLGAVLPGVLVSLTNEERVENKVGRLEVSDKLTEAANLKARDMAKKGYFSHTTPEGYSPWYWLNKVGYTYNYAGENLAVNFFESKDVAKAWMASPSHRGNIVNPHYEEIGIGMADGVYEGKDTVFVVQFFGSPRFVSSSVVPLATSASNSTLTVVSTSSKVLGAETNLPAPVKITFQGENELASVAFIKTISATPRSNTFYLLTLLSVIIFMSMLFVYFSRAKILHRDLILTGFLLVLIISVILSINDKIFTKTVGLPADNSGTATTTLSH